MAYSDHIKACNQWQPSHFIPWTLDDQTIGWLRPEFARHLRTWPRWFRVLDDSVAIAADTRDPGVLSAQLATIVQQLAEQGVISHLHGERYPVTANRRCDAHFTIDRAAAHYFGVRAFGQHLNGFVEKPDGLYLWVGKRASDRIHYPGFFDHMVAGGLPAELSLEDNLVKECQEEAGVPAELARQARATGCVTYCAETPKGLKPDVIYCYDLSLPEDFTPRNQDREVEDFYLWSLPQVAETVRETARFKLNCNLVIIDFLIRHGFIGPEHAEYLELTQGLHAKLP
jgi:isopentenyldiphosphate isomerase